MQNHSKTAMPAKRYPLPKRINAALSEKAYQNLRALKQKYQYGNNYLLTILLENLNTITDDATLDRIYNDFKNEYGAPSRSEEHK